MKAGLNEWNTYHMRLVRITFKRKKKVWGIGELLNFHPSLSNINDIWSACREKGTKISVYVARQEKCWSLRETYLVMYHELCWLIRARVFLSNFNYNVWQLVKFMIIFLLRQIVFINYCKANRLFISLRELISRF